MRASGAITKLTDEASSGTLTAMYTMEIGRRTKPMGEVCMSM